MTTMVLWEILRWKTEAARIHKLSKVDGAKEKMLVFDRWTFPFLELVTILTSVGILKCMVC